jgi:transcriptional regulator with GAF, ATPase, and Fis domain
MSVKDPGDMSRRDPGEEERDPLEEAGENLADAARAVRMKTDSQDADVVSGLRSLVGICRRISSIVNLRPLLTGVVDAILRISGTERGFIMLYEPDGALTFVLGRTKDGDDLPEQEFRISMSTAVDVAAGGPPVMATGNDALRALREKRSVRALELNTIICVPLKTESGLQGVLYADSRFSGRELNDVRVEIVNSFAEQAAVAIENARQYNELRHTKMMLEMECGRLRREQKAQYGLASIVGRSPSMLELFSVMEKVAQTSATVLLEGETGTGKEMVARTIHFLSIRQDAAFVALNCGALVETLLESELFGHKKGSFTGATEDRPGLFETSHGGTLFLDEISEMSSRLQVKLLRALQEGEIVRVGENKPRKVDARVISATNKDLEGAIERGEFRPDLFYRLNVVTLRLPPLRERGDDILLLAEYFLEKYSREGGRGPRRLAPGAASALMAYTWPGNVRELENVIERAVALGVGSEALTLDLLPPKIGGGSSEPPVSGRGSYKSQLELHERRMLAKALAENDWNVARVAASMDVSKQHIYNRMRKLGIDKAGAESGEEAAH